MACLSLNWKIHWRELRKYIDTKTDTSRVKVSVISVDSGTYGLGAEVNIKIKFTEPVLVEGQPYLELNIPERSAIYTSGSGTDTLEFIYTVGEGENQLDGLDYPSTDSLELGEGGNIKDIAGNEAILTSPTLDGFPKPVERCKDRIQRLHVAGGAYLRQRHNRHVAKT